MWRQGIIQAKIGRCRQPGFSLQLIGMLALRHVRRVAFSNRIAFPARAELLMEFLSTPPD